MLVVVIASWAVAAVRAMPITVLRLTSLKNPRSELAFQQFLAKFGFTLAFTTYLLDFNLLIIIVAIINYFLIYYFNFLFFSLRIE